jgi:hypothetical protein
MSLTSPELPAPSAEGFIQLSAKVDALSEDVKSLQAQMAARQTGPPREEVLLAIDQVRQMTEAIFGRVLAMEETCDIEDESWQVIVVHVEDAGPLDAKLARSRAWHKNLAQFPPGARGLFRLSVNLRG